MRSVFCVKSKVGTKEKIGSLKVKDDNDNVLTDVEESMESEEVKDSQEDDGEVAGSTTDFLSGLASKFKDVMHMGKEPVEKFLDSPDVDGIVKYILSGKCKNIITMAGAGISTSAGIPDFRSPGTGLYNNLVKYNLPYPTAIFELGYFMENPEPFFVLAKELFPGHFNPTPCHYFVRLLQEKGLLLRHYTQNIDTLERESGLSDDKVVEAHGTFHTGHCLVCNKEYSMEWMKEQIFTVTIPRCLKENCPGVVKPDIVFFGESLPEKFHKFTMKDFSKCDLLIIMGTSLLVQPFASLTSRVSSATPRLYINLEKTQDTDPISALLAGYGHGFMFDKEDNYRDVFLQGTCDDGCIGLVEKLGWKNDLDKLMNSSTKGSPDGKTNQAAGKDGKKTPKKPDSSSKKTSSKPSPKI